MPSADSLTNFRLSGPPQVRASSFLQSLLNLLNKHAPFLAFGRHNDVLAYPVYQASYPFPVLTHRYSIVPIRQYRSLPVGFLHCCRYQQPACHLLTVSRVLGTRKGLTPSGNFSCCTSPIFSQKFVFSNFFQTFQLSGHMLMLGTHKL